MLSIFQTLFCTLFCIFLLNTQPVYSLTSVYTNTLETSAKKVQLNTHDASGYTPLILAVLNRNHDEIKALIKAGANVNLSRDTKKIYYGANPETDKTPLMYAIALQDMKSIQILLKHGANINYKSKVGLTPLLFAIDTKNNDLIKFVYKKTRDKKDPKIMAQAIRSGNYEATSFFLKQKLPLTYKNKFDNVLTLAIKSQNLDVYQEILKQTPSLMNTPAPSGDYPIMVALKQNSTRIYQDFIKKKGLDITVKNPQKQTLLHLATQRFKTDNIIKELLDMGIDANAQDIHGKPALFYMVIRRNNSIVTYLIQKTDLSLKDKDNRSVFFYAMNHYEVFNILKIKYPEVKLSDKDLEGKSLLEYIIDRGNYRCLELFKKDLKKDVDSFHSIPALSIAVRKGSYDMVKILLDAGFDPDGIQGYMPPLLRAVELNKINIAYLLLFYGADASISYEGRTASSIAESFRYVQLQFLLHNYNFSQVKREK